MFRSIAIGSFSLVTISTLCCSAASAATVYVADFGISTIHKVDTVTGSISALNVDKDPTGINGIHYPFGLTFDQNGILWETELNAGIRKIDVTTGAVTPFLTNGSINGGLTSPGALAFDRNGTLWEADYGHGINKIDPTTGTVTPFLTNGSVGGGFQWLAGLAFDQNGGLWASDKNGGGINKIDTITGAVTSFAISGNSRNDGYLCPATPIANGLRCPVDLAFDPSGRLFETDYAGSINTIDTVTGFVTPFFPNGKPAQFSHPMGIAFAPSSISANDSTAAPEPFTIVGTLIGGTTAMRMRKKLKNANKA